MSEIIEPTLRSELKEDVEETKNLIATAKSGDAVRAYLRLQKVLKYWLMLAKRDKL